MNQAPLFIEYLETTRPEIVEHMKTMGAHYTQDEPHDLEKYLYGPLNTFIHNYGKLTRPAICLLGAMAAGADRDQAKRALDVACAIENFQAAALIHDDIADQGELRRSIPCMHITEGVGLAINCGDMALVGTRTDILMSETYSDSEKIALLKEFSFMIQKTIEGQALDLGWARDDRWDISTEDYLQMAALKTAHYSCASPLVLGALCQGADEETREGLRKFGLLAGIAFQIQDDMLNLFGDAESQGKDYRSDIAEGKHTLLVVSALERLEGKEKQELIDILSSHSKDRRSADRACELILNSGAQQYTQEYALELTRKSKEILEELNITIEAKEILISMTDFFIQRNK